MSLIESITVSVALFSPFLVAAGCLWLLRRLGVRTE